MVTKNKNTKGRFNWNHFVLFTCVCSYYSLEFSTLESSLQIPESLDSQCWAALFCGREAFRTQHNSFCFSSIGQQGPCMPEVCIISITVDLDGGMEGGRKCE